MKKQKQLLILSFLIGIGSAYSQNVNIPDANFKAYLVGNAAINTNMDTEIQVSEANAFTGTITLNSLNITDLTGIEEFTSLTQLHMYYNPITSMDISQNTALTILHVYINSLTSLDVSNNTALVELRFERNPIMNIDVSNLTNLEFLSCGNTGLTNLDVTNNLNLGFLDIGGNPAFGNVNQITALNLANNTELHHLGTRATQMATLDLTNNVGLETLDCSSNNLATLDVSMLPNLEYLGCSLNSIASLDVSNNLSLTDLFFASNPIIGAIDVSNHISLKAIDCHNTQISALNIANGNNSNFTNMWAYSNPNLTCVEVDDATWSTANWNAWNNIDATASYSEDCAGTAAIQESEVVSMSIYPNPASSTLTIETEAFIENIQILGVNGALVQSETTSNFSVASLTNGVYFIQVKTNDGIITKRLIKE